jgi:hypothetical protein
MSCLRDIPLVVVRMRIAQSVGKCYNPEFSAGMAPLLSFARWFAKYGNRRAQHLRTELNMVQGMCPERWCDKLTSESRCVGCEKFFKLNCCFGLGFDTGFGFGLSSVRQLSEEAVKSGILDRGFESRSHHQMEQS